MKRLQAYKFELMPDGEQQRQMRRFAGACRFVYNKALAWQNAQYAQDNTFKFSYTKLANLFGLARWIPCRRTTPQHQSHLPVLWARIER